MTTQNESDTNGMRNHSQHRKNHATRPNTHNHTKRKNTWRMKINSNPLLAPKRHSTAMYPSRLPTQHIIIPFNHCYSTGSSPSSLHPRRSLRRLTTPELFQFPPLHSSIGLSHTKSSGNPLRYVVYLGHRCIIETQAIIILYYNSMKRERLCA